MYQVQMWLMRIGQFCLRHCFVQLLNIIYTSTIIIKVAGPSKLCNVIRTVCTYIYNHSLQSVYSPRVNYAPCMVLFIGLFH